MLEKEEPKDVMFMLRVYTTKDNWFYIELGSKIDTVKHRVHEIHYYDKNGRMYPTIEKCLGMLGVDYKFDLETPLAFDMGCVHKKGKEIISQIWIPLLAINHRHTMFQRGLELLRTAILLNSKNLCDTILDM